MNSKFPNSIYNTITDFYDESDPLRKAILDGNLKEVLSHVESDGIELVKHIFLFKGVNPFLFNEAVGEELLKLAKNKDDELYHLLSANKKLASKEFTDNILDNITPLPLLYSL